MTEELQHREREIKEIRLKKATVEDIPTLISIEEKIANVRIYSAMTDAQEWRDELSKGNTTVYLIMNGEEIIGDVSYEKRDDNSAYISGLAIDPKFQSMGIGQETMKMVLEELKDVQTIELVTHPDNEAALKLYESLGFVVKEKKENYFGDGEPRILMVKEQKLDK